MRILGIDFETTGLEAANCRVTEIGAVLWDWEEKKPIQMYSELITDFKGNHDISSEIIELTGITPAMCTEFGVGIDFGLSNLQDMEDKADYFMAHNAPFDKKFYIEECIRQNIPPSEKGWIDTCADVPYPKRFKAKNLVTLAAEHGFVNPFPHRAATDVLTMLKVAAHYDFDEILRYFNSPTITLRAMVTFHEKDKAKQAGYRWDGDNKWWLKNIKTFQFEDEVNLASELDFKIRRMNSDST